MADFKMDRSGDRLFLKACELADTPPTKRQMTKWRRGYGKAYRHMHEAIAAINNAA